MAKDPVLPLYYNDIDSSTRDWTDEEFGAYMRLLIYQWDKGGLPKDYQRLTRIATSLDTTWAMIQKKFQEVEGKLKNPVMEDIRDKRLRHKAKQLENINKRYQTSTNIPTKPPTKNLPLEEEKEKEIEKEYVNGFGKSENLFNNALVGQMQDIWKKTFANYTHDKESDFPACKKIADFIFRNAGVKNGYGDNDSEIMALNTFQLIADNALLDPFWANKPLKSISNNIQEFYNKIKNPINGSKSKQGLDDNKLKQKLAERNPNRK